MNMDNMNERIRIKVAKKSLTNAIRALSKGYRAHKKYSDIYVIAFSVNSSGLVTASVLGGEYTFEAETTGSGNFAISYKWMQMFVRGCKLKQIDMEIENESLRLNNIALSQIKFTRLPIHLPLSIFYTPGEILRMNLSDIKDEIIDFWKLQSQIEDANDQVRNVIDTVYIKLSSYLPPTSTESEIKRRITDIILGNRES